MEENSNSKKLKRYRLYLLNDDYNDMAIICHVLETLIGYNQEVAYGVMLTAHLQNEVEIFRGSGHEARKLQYKFKKMEIGTKILEDSSLVTND